MADNAAALASSGSARTPDPDVAAKLAECDVRLEKYRTALEAGVDPEIVGVWIAAVKAERAAALAGAVTERARANFQGPLSEEAIKNIVQALGDMRQVIEKRLARGQGPCPRRARAAAHLRPRHKNDQGRDEPRP